MLRKSGVVSAVLLVVASGVAHADFTPSPEPGEWPTPIPAPAAAPKSFRWVPYPGLPEGAVCATDGNDQGVAAVVLGSGATAEIWRASASGSRRLPLPVGTQLATTHGHGRVVALSTGTGQLAALVEVPGTEHYSVRYRLVRWDERGQPQMSGALPIPELPLEPTIADLVGVTPRGDIIVRQQQWNGDARWAESDFLAWRVDGSWSTLHHDVGARWATDYRGSTELAHDGSFVTRRSLLAPSSTLIRPNATLTGATATTLGAADGREVDVVSADGRWWAGRDYSISLPAGDTPWAWKVAFGVAKGWKEPASVLALHDHPEGGAHAYGINNQGTVIYHDGAVVWRNGTRVTTVSRDTVQRLPHGSTLPSGPYEIDTAGRLITHIVQANGRCRSGVLAPQW